jgi:small-conductance mechanosensitive channel
MRRSVVLGSLIVASFVLGFAFLEYPYRPDQYSDLMYKAWLSVTVLAALYFIFRFVIEPLGARRFKDPKMSYSFRKVLSILLVLISITALLAVWIEETPILLVSYGLILAGIAVALQDLFKNFMGGIIIFTTGFYNVGDRVDIGGKLGDIVDIGIMYTTLLETKGWLEGEQPTGRLTSVPNGQILSQAVNNYTKDFSFVWDELVIPITYDSDWKKASVIMKDSAIQMSQDDTISADRELDQITGKYYITKTMVEPVSYLRLTDNWVEVSVRYIVSPRNRRTTKSKLSLIVSDEFTKVGNIRIASQTVEIVRFPELRVKSEDKGL